MSKTTFHPQGWAPLPGYSHAVLSGGGRLLFVSGQVALDPAGKLVGGDDFEAQATHCFENLETVLATAGSSFAHIVKLGYFVVDLDGEKLQTLRRVRGRFLPTGDPPASTLLGVQRLFLPGVLVEIEAVAEIP